MEMIKTALLANYYLFAGLLFVLGACIGSFLNVVIYRLPLMLERRWRDESIICLGGNIENHKIFNLFLPTSHCPKCSTHIPFWANIPIISYIFLKAKCHYCHVPISIRYPLVELLTAILFAATVNIAYQDGLISLCAYLCFISLIVSMIFIDYDTMLLPDELTLALLWLGLIANLLYPLAISLSSAVLGAIAGYLLLWLVFHAFKLITHKEGMGFGDFKLLAALGAWFGMEAIVYIVLIASVSSIIYTIFLKLVGKFTNRNQPIPFGPFLGLAGLIWLFSLKIVSWH